MWQQMYIEVYVLYTCFHLCLIAHGDMVIPPTAHPPPNRNQTHGCNVRAISALIYYYS